jgi:hypothetical protein
MRETKGESTWSQEQKNDERDKLHVGWVILLLFIYICGHTCDDIHHHYHICWLQP